MIRRNYHWAGIALATAFGIVPARALAYTAHYFVVTESRNGELAVAHHRMVELDGPVEATASRGRLSRHESRLEARIVDKASGSIRFSTLATSSPWLRGEFHGSDSIDARFHPLEVRHYVVRIPAETSATLHLAGLDAEPAAPLLAAQGLSIDLDQARESALKAGDTTALPAGWASGTILANGPSANRLDLLIVAEGYTAAQQAKFVADATALTSNFLNESPYSVFRQLINVSYLFVPSRQSGADRPNCSNTMVDTAFDATFCTAGSDRLLTVDLEKVQTAAANVPDWDKLLVLVNSDTYGGSGGFAAVASTQADSVEVMRHEFGHQFSLLDDEYDTPFPGFPTCSDRDEMSPCGPNTTDVTNRAQIKWNGWINAATPIPTTNPIADPLGAGLWLGARYAQPGMYRQCFNGKMKSLNRPFCRVDSEAFVKRVYGGWDGVPSNGVSTIEPGATPAAASVTGAVNSDVDFSATIVGSSGSNVLSYAWLVDNVAAKTGTGNHSSVQTFTYRIPDTGNHTVVLRVTDTTNLLLQPKVSTRTWAVSAGPPPATVVEYLDTLDFPGSPGGHFFYSSDPAEQAAVDAGAAGRFSRTGRTFKTGGTSPVCRFYGSITPGPNSHFFTVNQDECNALKAMQRVPTPTNVQQWNYERIEYNTTPPAVVNGQLACPAGTAPLYRAYNNAFTAGGVKNPWDSNHRFTPLLADIAAMVAQGWRDEGLQFCTAQ